ncbi:MAG: aminotransferase class V-fold PLP-dependent enzyme [Candidatus Eisenbacteria bacterium]|nr:aminotransferase class V-fold PLP-dependent enzyme [Candidatus Eisenbacteria bacterium]
MKVPLLDLKRQYQVIKDDVDAAIREVVESQIFIKGPKVKELEERIADYCGTKRAVGCASGTDAILLSLMALDVGPGDEVITTPYTFFATGGSIARVGATPVFVDIEPATYNLDPEKIAERITPKTKAILPVHLYGQCVDMDPVLELAREHGLAVVEDAAQAIGAEYRGRRAGSMGHTGCFSFFPSKNLGGYGDGGMVTTNDEDLADRLVSLREHGQSDKYFYCEVGANSRLDAIQAAVLLVKLKHLDTWSNGRAANADFYGERFDGTPVVAPHREAWNRHIYNQYTIRVPDRDALLEHLRGKGIGCALYYPLSLHLQTCFAGLGYSEGDFPESERAQRETISIPVFSLLSEEEKETVASTILDFVS